MEVQIADSEDPYYIYKAISSEPQKWETLGNIGLFISAFVAIGAFVPAAMKKRVYTFTPTPTGGAPAPVEAAQVEAAAEPGVTPAPRCTLEEQAKIVELFTTIADGSIASLAWSAYRLNQLGGEIHHVHPFALLQAMPREKIRQIFLSDSAFKKGRIINGINEGMQRERDRNNLNRYIPGFASSMQKEEARTRQLIQAADWLGLVQYLFEIPAARAG